MTESDEQIIPGIHNYCDRWCERCAFTARCGAFALEAEFSVADTGDPIEDAVRTVAMTLADAKEMLVEKAKEMGIDVDKAISDPEIEEGMRRRRDAVASQQAVQLSKSYATKVQSFIDEHRAAVCDEHDPLSVEMLEIIQWYLFFIAAKVHRGFHGILDRDGEEDPDLVQDNESDANGSIKIALISIERSVLAWTYLMNEMNSSIIRPHIDTLEMVAALAERKFPNARDFIRPGFDEIETVM